MAAELIFTKDGVGGNVPGRLRTVVTDLSGVDQRGLLAGLRSRYYSAEPTAALAYAAQDLTPLDAAAAASVDGVAAVRHANLATSWTPVLSTLIDGIGHMDHRGAYNVWVWVRSTSTVPPRMRLVYDVGDLTLPEENLPAPIPAPSNWYLLNLGGIRLDRVGVPHRWAGQIQAIGAAGGEDVAIRRIWFQPTAEGQLKIGVPLNAEQGLSDYVARDEFNQSAGALTGKADALGLTWAGAGDSDGFSVETTGKTAERTAQGDTAPETGRYAISGAAAFAAQVVRVDFKRTAGAGSYSLPTGQDYVRMGVLARYVDVNNYLFAGWARIGGGPLGNYSLLRVGKRVSGTFTVLQSVVVAAVQADAWYTAAVAVDAAGRYGAWLHRQGSGASVVVASGQDPALASGGALASGKPGFYDLNFFTRATTADTRNFKNFAAFPPTPDAAIFADQAAELSWDGVTRLDSGGGSPGPLTPEGDLLRLPVSGSEDRSVEFFLLASEGDFDQMPDNGMGEISARPHVRPCSLFLPGG